MNFKKLTIAAAIVAMTSLSAVAPVYAQAAPAAPPVLRPKVRPPPLRLRTRPSPINTAWVTSGPKVPGFPRRS